MRADPCVWKMLFVSVNRFIFIVPEAVKMFSCLSRADVC